MKDNNQITSTFWSNGLSAKIYRKIAQKQYLGMHQKITSLIQAHHAQNVLDIACGGGDFLFHLSSMAPEVKLFGTDIAAGMIRSAQSKLGNKATISEATGDHQPFPDNIFDAVTIMMAFHHFPAQIAALQEAKRLLKPNGIIIIGDVVARSNFQKRLWDISERITAIRGFIGHYAESDLKSMAQTVGLACDIEPIPNMAKRYKVCVLRVLSS